MERTIGLAALLSGVIVLAGCNSSTNQNEAKLRQYIDERVETSVNQRMNYSPVHGRETYEIPCADYQGHLENLKGGCFKEPKISFMIPAGRGYLVRTDSTNAFDRPLKPVKDQFNQYVLPLGSYEVWMENKGFFAPVGKFDARFVPEPNIITGKKGKEFNPDYVEENIRLKVYDTRTQGEQPINQDNLTPALEVNPAPLPKAPKADSP